LRVEPLEDRRLLAITVDTLLDVVDDGDGVTSLREAIATANSTSEDEINFSVTGEIDLLLGELQIADSLTIAGPGRELLTIDAHQQSRVLNYESGFGDLTIVGLTLKGGNTTGNVAYGGGIHFVSSGSLYLNDSDVIDNHASGHGGGIYARKLVVTNSTLSGNSALGVGGGISGNSLDIFDSTIAKNTSVSGLSGGGGIWGQTVTLVASVVTGNSTTGKYGRGGGLTVRGSGTFIDSVVSHNSTSGEYSGGGGIHSLGGAITLTRSVISGNRTSGTNAEGGGIYSLGPLTLSSSTVSNNKAELATGGGIAARRPVTLVSSTVSGNQSANLGGGISMRFGGVKLNNSTVTNNVTLQSDSLGAGIFVYAFGEDTTIESESSILAGNHIAGSSSISQEFASDGNLRIVANNTLIGIADGVTLTGDGNQSGTAANPLDPLLAPLANNGGPTKTHALLPGSPALDAGRAMFVNVAREGVASQSSDFEDDFLASRAIDGNTATLTHTAIDDANPHWQVALAAEYAISEIILHNRDDCCGSRLRDITVEILDASDNVVFTSELLNPENVLGGSMVNVGPETLRLDLVELTGAAVLGRTVRVTRTPDPDFSGSGGVGPVGEENVLSLGEVEIFAVDQRGLPRVVDGGSGLRQDIGAYEAQTQPTLLLGDADNDGAVAGSDLLAVTNHFGATGTANGLLPGDADDDGAVAGGDLLAVTNNFGAAGSQTGAAVLSDAASDEAFAVYPKVVPTAKTQAIRLVLDSNGLPTNTFRDELLLLAGEFIVSQRDDGFMETDLNEEESEDAAAETIFELLSPV